MIYWHHQVLEASSSTKLKLSPPMVINDPNRPATTTDMDTSATRTVMVFPYSCDFDGFVPATRCFAITMLLDLLPNVMEMRQYLMEGNHTLARWTDRINPSSLGVLRWIVASNRAHIVQVDQPECIGSKHMEDRVQGTQGWLQFRFAMGSPAKEQSFLDAIKAETIKQTFPTLFAWHGSPLSNWFGIIHDGLNFEKMSHGRAYGDGVYHAKDFATSLGYCKVYPNAPVCVNLLIVVPLLTFHFYRPGPRASYE